MNFLKEMVLFSTALFVPFKCAFAEHIVEANQKDGHKHEHGKETAGAHGPEVDRIRVKEYDLHIEEYEQNGSHQVFNGYRYAGVALRFDATFKVLIFFLAASARSKFWDNNQYERYKPKSNKGLHDHG